jgi:hypothetical protein
MSHDSNILIYFLISNLNPQKKIFELINTANKEAYIQALEIYHNYVNQKEAEDIKEKKIKIPKEDNHAFHVYISKEELIFISYSNNKYFSTELNFDMFQEINEYLTTEINRKINETQSFLIEDEKDEIKDIINYYLEEYSFLESLNTIQTESISEDKDATKDNKNINVNDDKNVELTLKSEKKKDTSQDKLLKKTIVIGENKSLTKSKQLNFRHSLKLKHLARTEKLDKSRVKNKLKFKLDANNKDNKKNINNDIKYELINLMYNKSNNCSKIVIMIILSLIIAIEIIATILFIYFYNYIK